MGAAASTDGVANARGNRVQRSTSEVLTIGRTQSPMNSIDMFLFWIGCFEFWRSPRGFKDESL